MTNEEFIAELEQSQTIDSETARQLRAKAAEGGTRVTPDSLLKLLVKTDAITAWKGEELAAMLYSSASVTDDPDDILDLMPMSDDDDPREQPGWKAPIDASGAPPGLLEPDEPQSTGQPLFSSKAVRLNDPSALDDFPPAAGKGSGPAKGGYRLGGDKKKSRTKRTAGGKNQWDSPLLLLGGGALVVLVVGGAILYYLLIRENADAVLADANNLFDSGAYRQASARYEEFAEKFPRNQDVSEARVRAEMSKLWEAAESNPPAALPEAKRVIAEIEDEPAFISGAQGQEGPSTAKQELGAILVRIGKALVEQAEGSTDQKEVAGIIEQLDAMLALSSNEKYVPAKVRNDAELAAIAESLEVIRARQQRDERLAVALTAMEAALAAGDSATAYKERLSLLADYPALADDASLASKVRDASTAEQARVKFIPSDKPAETAWPPRPIVAELALAERRGSDNALPADTNEPVVVRVDGALYGLSSGDGALLWRRFAGYGPAGAPLKVAGDVIAADLRGGELWRLNATTGKLVWRLPLGDQVTGVVSAGARLLATGASGKLFVVDAATGALAGHVEFAQPIRTAPVLNDRGDRIYLAAEHSILYTLASEDLACIGVYYSGHAAGAIVAPPIAVLNKVIVADNTGTETSRLRVFSVDGNGAIENEIAGERLAGLVITPMARAARRIAVATTVGQVAVVEISGAADQTALSIVARRDGKDAQPTARFALIHDGRLWLAARQLMALDILPTESQLSVRSLDQDFNGDAFDDALQGVGPLVISVRRPAGRAGVVVAATDSAANQVAWQTEIAVPLAGAPSIDSKRLLVSAITASGAVFILDRAALTRGIQDEALRASLSLPGELPLTTSVDLGAGRLAAAAIGGTRILLVEPGNQQQPATKFDVPSPLSCPLTLWNEQIVVATQEGRVTVYDPQTAAQAAAPFLPELQPGTTFQWLSPTTTSADANSQLVIADGAETLYRIATVAAPAPHLAAEASVDVGPAPLGSPLALAGGHVFAGTQDGRLASYALPDLKPTEPTELGGRIVWGPHQIGDELLLATDANELLAVDGAGAIRWRQPLEHGALGGKPLPAGGDVLVLSIEGGIARVALADGTEAAFSDLGQPAVAGPVPLGERVVVVGADGSLLVVNRP